MHSFFIAILAGLLAIVLTMIITMFVGKTVYDKLNALFVINTNIVMLILVVGLIDDRMDMHIDIALSYALLGFITTVILAKFIGGRR
ncbi:monovalent cation/H+ antiporter complex subunit F [Mogibacterium sp. CM50]|jgi:Multiple resistance and pH regulation protein F (MrpF / PhaF).|uniref:monovalent cation/H+ antiporter complex subunit F n=1 Tax=Mogibacterium sp. CM50 TaxID=936375 RepID=UPI00027C391C|nr:monovalent cation/H+ antiporter complex subunit F [Mogibacterium sp. CM50]EJU19287.1 multiple resistance and pH regulation protein F, MrpF/PhaF family [Mogibacterium sp. CM50]